MMEKLIDINSYPVSVVLKALLKDKTTGKNIIFATSAYTENGRTINEKEQITEEILKGLPKGDTFSNLYNAALCTSTGSVLHI